MPISVTTAWEEAIAANAKNTVPLITLELIHSAFLVGGVMTPIRVVQNTEDMTFRLEAGAPVGAGTSVLFTAMPFEIEYPRIGELGATVPLRLDNVNREMQPYLDQAVKVNEPITVIARGYLSTDPLTVAMGPYRLYLRNVKVRMDTLEGQLAVADPRNRRVLNDVYDIQRFPALMAAAS